MSKLEHVKTLIICLLLGFSTSLVFNYVECKKKVNDLQVKVEVYERVVDDFGLEEFMNCPEYCLED